VRAVGLALVHAVAALVVAGRPAVADLTPRQKAALVVVSGLPAPTGVGGVLVQRWNHNAPRPPGALVFVAQEGDATRAFRELPPARPAAAYTTEAQALAVGRARRTARSARASSAGRALASRSPAALPRPAKAPAPSTSPGSGRRPSPPTTRRT